MAGTMISEFWAPEDTGTKRFLAAMAIGLLLEAGAIGSVLEFSRNTPPPTDKPSIVKLSVINPAPPTPPPPPPPVIPPTPVPPPPVPVPVTPPPPPPPVPHHAATKPPPPHHITPPRPAAPLPPVETAPPAPTPPPPPAPAAPSAGELDIFRAAMRAAVRAAAHTPPAAAMTHQFGVTRISFTFLNGAVSNLQVVASSGYPLLDQAALAAARNAGYPPVPPDMAGHPDNVVVDVVFHPVATSVDSD